MTSKSPTLAAFALLLSLTGSVVLACGDDEKDNNGTPSGESGAGGDGGSSDTGGEPGNPGAGGGSAGEGPSSGGGGASGGEAGGSGEAGAGGMAPLTDGDRLTGGIMSWLTDRCTCLIDQGAYEDQYECLATDGFAIFDDLTADCIDDLAAESELAGSYIACVADNFADLGNCFEERGSECAAALGSEMGCPDGGVGTRCNAIEDCADGSDEEDCPADFECTGGGTVTPAAVCDGLDGCADGSDEDDCEGKLACNQAVDLTTVCGTAPAAVDERFNICVTLSM